MAVSFQEGRRDQHRCVAGAQGMSKLPRAAGEEARSARRTVPIILEEIGHQCQDVLELLR